MHGQSPAPRYSLSSRSRDLYSPMEDDLAPEKGELLIAILKEAPPGSTADLPPWLTIHSFIVLVKRTVCYFYTFTHSLFIHRCRSLCSRLLFSYLKARLLYIHSLYFSNILSTLTTYQYQDQPFRSESKEDKTAISQTQCLQLGLSRQSCFWQEHLWQRRSSTKPRTRWW